MSTDKPIIGRREWMQFPDLGIPAIEAKIDTGARSTSLHTHDYEVYDHRGEKWVRFHLHPLTSTDEIELTCTAPVIEFKEVKDSGGHVEERPFIETKARMGSHEWVIAVNLTNRENMKFRMLLGRTAMAGFLVDPSKGCLASQDLSSVYKG